MSEIVIATDSVAQIPPEMAQSYNIGVIPFSIIIEGHAYRDGVDISPAELYRRMRTEDIIPKTSQPSLGEYLDFFRRYFAKDTQTILYLSVSEKLSGAFSTASKAAHLLEQEFPGKSVVVYNTQMATIAQGYLAIKAAEEAHNGGDLARLLALVRESRPNVGFIAMFETLYYLERGGRIGKAAYLAGSLVHIKPLITIDQEGLVAPMGNLRGDKKCAGKLVDCLADLLGNQTLSRIAVMHADNPEKVERLRQLAGEQFNMNEILVTEFSPVMGAHAGPGVLGLGYLIN